MITVQLRSRLGNQMFQYAAALALADRRQTAVTFDLSLLNLSGDKFELSCFGIKPIETPIKELPLRQRVGTSIWLKKGKRLLEKLLPTVRRTVFVEESPFSFQKEFFDYSSRSYLSGYFQNEIYFKAISEKIRQEFTIRSAISEQTKALLLKMRNQIAVSVHVRRGDYVENREYNLFFGTCSSNYYIKACEAIRHLVRSPFWIFCSDDPSWVRSSLVPALRERKLVNNYAVVDWTGGRRSFEDIHLMRSANHNIISNSSFGWWGAWLNPQQNKMVFAPSQWLRNRNHYRDANSIVPIEWIKISNNES